MSEIRVNKLINETGSGSVELTQGATLPSGKTISGAGGLNVTGVVTATTFSGNITGVAATFSGNVSIAGTLTYEDVTNVDSIGVITARSGVVVSGAGLTVTGISTFANDVRFRGGVIENVSAATTYMSGGALVLELDVRNSTTYRYSMLTGATIGIVSFKNLPADTENGSTVTVLFTQPSSITAGTGNTTAATGIGTNCTVIPFVSGAAIAGISTRALVGSATTVTLSSTASDVDFVSFFVHYTGGTSSAAASYKIYATKNGGFGQGSIGV